MIDKRSEVIHGLFEKVDDMMRRTPKTLAEHIQDFKHLPIIQKDIKHCQGVLQCMAIFMETLFFGMASEAENEGTKKFYNSVLCSLLQNFAFICVLPLNFFSILMLLDYPQPLHIFMTQTWPTLLKTKQIYFLGYSKEVGKYFSLQDYVDLYSNFETFDFSRMLNSYGHSFLTLAISVEKLMKNKFYVQFFLDHIQSSLSETDNSLDGLEYGNGSGSGGGNCCLNAPNYLGWTPLCWALSLHLVDTAKLLIESKANVKIFSFIENKSIKPMQLAIEKQQSEIFGVIQNAYKSKERLVSEKFVLEVAAKFAVAQNQAGMTFLGNHVTQFLDSFSGDDQDALCIKKCFAIVNLNQPVDTEGNTILHTVVHQENYGLFTRFLKWNDALAEISNHRQQSVWCIDPRIQNSKGNTVLHVMAKQVKRALLTSDINEWWDWISVVHHLIQVLMLVVGPAKCQNKEEILKQFVNMKNKRGQTCLHLLAAISLQRANLIKPEVNGSLNSYQVKKMESYEALYQFLMEECGASLYSRVDPLLTEMPWTQLNFFKESQLSSRHAKLEQFGKNALMLAISHGNVSFYRYVFEKQKLHFDIFQKDNYGNTVLHLAILAGEHYFNQDSNFFFDRFEFSPLLQIHFAVFTNIRSSIDYLVSAIRSTALVQKPIYTGVWENTDLFNSVNVQQKSFLHLAVENIVPLRVQDYKILFENENECYFQFQDNNLKTPLMLALSSSKNFNNLPLFMTLSKDIVFDMKDCKGKNVFHILMENFSETKHKQDFFDFLMEEQFQRQWARVSCVVFPQYASCREEKFHIKYVLKYDQISVEKNEIDVYRNRALVLNQEDHEQRSPFHRAYLEHNETMTLLMLKHGASWYDADSSAFFDFVHERSLINQRLFKSYIEDNFIWRQKILVFKEAFKYSGSKTCHVSKLCKEILNQIFRLGFQDAQQHELFLHRLKKNVNCLAAYRKGQKYNLESALENHTL